MALSLYEEVVLLAFHDEEGTPIGDAPEVAIASAVLADLADRGRLDVSDDKRPRVSVLDATPTEDELLDDVLDKVASARRDKTMATWIERITLFGRFRERVTSSLVQRGVLAVREHKILWVFPSTQYPTSDPIPEEQVVARLRAAIDGDGADVGDVDSRTCLLVAIADATGLLSGVLQQDELKAHRERIDALSGDERIGAATRRAVRSAEMTAAAAVTAAATTAGNVANS